MNAMTSRNYERRMQALLEKIRARYVAIEWKAFSPSKKTVPSVDRLSWLKKGSRDVFGTILEKNIYILIDTSKSMQNHLNFVKDKLRLLIQVGPFLLSFSLFDGASLSGSIVHERTCKHGLLQ